MLPGKFYHIFNHANGRENLFTEDRNFLFFLHLINKHILSTSRLYAYALMPNHFHLLIQIKTEAELLLLLEKDILLKQKANTGSFNCTDFLLQKSNKPFSNFLNSYTQSYNKVYHRMGSLFMQNTKQKEITDNTHFCKVVHYLHANPVHHRFVKTPAEWPYTSYNILLHKTPTILERDYTLNAFGGLAEFIKYHQQAIDPKYKFFLEGVNSWTIIQIAIICSKSYYIILESLTII